MQAAPRSRNAPAQMQLHSPPRCWHRTHIQPNYLGRFVLRETSFLALPPSISIVAFQSALKPASELQWENEPTRLEIFNSMEHPQCGPRLATRLLYGPDCNLCHVGPPDHDRSTYWAEAQSKEAPLWPANLATCNLGGASLAQPPGIIF
jgi:hypothetical protein